MWFLWVFSTHYFQTESEWNQVSASFPCLPTDNPVCRELARCAYHKAAAPHRDPFQLPRTTSSSSSSSPSSKMKQHISHIILNSYPSSYFLKYFVCGRAPPSALCWLVSMETSRSPGDSYRGLTGGEVHYFSDVLGILIKESPRRPMSRKPTPPPPPPPPLPGLRFDSSPFKK